MNKKGFTLIELIVVIAILAILAAVAVPNFIGLTNKANTAVEVQNAYALANAFNVYNALEDPDLTTLDDAAIAAIETAGLKPAMDYDADNFDTHILARIEISDGIAQVTNKDPIS